MQSGTTIHVGQEIFLVFLLLESGMDYITEKTE